MTLRTDAEAPRLATRNMRLGYADKVIVPDMTLDFEPARIHCLIGPNGCGKSTLLRALAGLMRPQAGEVLLDGRPVTAWPRRHLARRLAMLPQHPQAPEGLSVEQLVRYGRFPHQRLLAPLTEHDHAQVRWAIRVTGLAGYEARPLSALSGGERQRAWIALCLAQQSDLLILDEPTTYLDLGHQLEILELLQALNREQGLTVIMSLHDLNQAAQVGHRLVAMRSGQLVQAGPPAEVLTERLLLDVFRIRARIVDDASATLGNAAASSAPYFVALSSLAPPTL
ncbi:ABC transporter ATP-binding protein [Halomonas sp. MCCC 1A17488]|uniref:ABC transporter ATP-binding protein n=1 Tax=unclassified Halomonas TaxID=2609666 RepID=UPI0018D22D9A|nr:MULTISPECIES: ABC transporter ATP-binding protein [unclassified Halomonas]MCE8016217.1 ABC transporter ATP-binding protein [Halomonas sp. MCCC 1A17488]MCG3239550.1 ABC transporter ATP-binding protein [Halomonas sp. MCCC 1A17488]QPP50530.1 ABC transporter ATP-binding protein [Halomonas sp. SS10-MC5]